MLSLAPVEQPPFIAALMDVLIGAITPDGFLGPLGYRWWGPDTPGSTFPGWTVVAYPTPHELRGGANDGAKGVMGFQLNIAAIVGAFSTLENLDWHAPVQYNGDLDGPEIAIKGQFAGKSVWLRVFHLPPSDEPASIIVDPVHKRAWEKQYDGTRE